jgi:uncharacterized glyoxalase superfamily protein PhnB
MAETKPVLSQINVVHGDVLAAIAFYRLLGVEVDETLPEWRAWDAHHRTLRTGVDGLEAELDSAAFAPRWSRGWPRGAAGVVLTFHVPEREAVDALYAKVTRAGFRGQQEPYDAFWGARYAIVEGPDGIAFGLMSPSDPARRSVPPDPATF